MVTNLNWVKKLSEDQEKAAELSCTARGWLSLFPASKQSGAIYFQEKAAAEYEACRSVYQLLFQES